MRKIVCVYKLSRIDTTGARFRFYYPKVSIGSSFRLNKLFSRITRLTFILYYPRNVGKTLSSDLSLKV